MLFFSGQIQQKSESNQPLIRENRKVIKHSTWKPDVIARAKNHDIYGLLTKREVKMARYWPSSFSSSRSINTQKMNKANIQQS